MQDFPELLTSSPLSQTVHIDAINPRGMQLSKVHSIEETCTPDMENVITETDNPPTAEILSSRMTGKGSVIIQFTERTTFHGIRYIAEDGCILRK